MDCQDQSDEVGCSEYILLKNSNAPFPSIFFFARSRNGKVSMLFRIIIEQAFLNL